MELKTLKISFKIYLKTEFIQLSKSPVLALILFHKKSDREQQLCTNNCGLNNLKIENQYRLFFIIKSRVKLGQAKQFT